MDYNARVYEDGTRILEKAKSGTASDADMYTVLVRLCNNKNNIPLIKEFLDLPNIDINHFIYGHTLLLLEAISCGSVEVVKFLIDNGADIELIGRSGRRSAISLSKIYTKIITKNEEYIKTGLCEIHFAKNRNGRCANVDLTFDGPSMRFGNKSDRTDEPEWPESTGSDYVK